jgi:hypothetical protein
MKKLLLPLLLLTTQPAFATDNALTECRQIEAVEERVACYDEYVDSRHPDRESTVPDAQSLFGADDADARRIVETTLAVEQIDRIEATVTGVMDSPGRKMLVVLDNGQTSRQLNNKRLQLEYGEGVIVRKASLGSYLLEKESGSRRVRVKRVN